MNDLIGRFHPVFIHLPIGILLLSCFFQILSSREKFRSLAPAVPVMVFWGMISAVASCVTGLFLAGNGDYDDPMVDQHRWAGIALALFSVVYFLMLKRSRIKFVTGASIMLIMLIMVTGHLGGSITHGTGYLTYGLTHDEPEAIIKPIPDIQHAAAYHTVVKPMLEARCYNCHGERKQKGKLRLDSPESITKGGKSGETIIAGNPDKSELIERLLLPVNHDDHMPPRGKPQLTRNQIAFLEWWVSTGADFNKKVNELKPTDKIAPVLFALQSGASSEISEVATVPEEPVVAADTADVNKLLRAGVVVIPVMQGSNYLSANFVTATGDMSANIKLLEPLRQQLVWLKLTHTTVEDASLDNIAKMRSLTRLQLSHTNITDKGLVKLQSLQQLQSLNLVGTKVTAQGLLALNKLKALKYLYLYQTTVRSEDWTALQKAFPSVILDTGNYKLQMLASDTTELSFK